MWSWSLFVGYIPEHRPIFNGSGIYSIKFCLLQSTRGVQVHRTVYINLQKTIKLPYVPRFRGYFCRGTLLRALYLLKSVSGPFHGSLKDLRPSLLLFEDKIRTICLLGPFLVGVYMYGPFRVEYLGHSFQNSF